CEVELVVPGDVRRRVKIEDRFTASEETIGRDNVARETGRLIGCGAGAVQQRIFDENLVAVAIGGLRKVAVTLGLRGNAHIVRPYRGELLIPLLIPVKEKLVLLLIETQERQINRAADVVPLVIIPIETASRFPIVAEGLELLRVAEVVIRVQPLVAV